MSKAGQRVRSARFAARLEKVELTTKTGKALRELHWLRGLRAGLAVATAVLVCHAFSHSIGWAAGWAALGGFEAILVDNGGPYRSRFATIATLLFAGSVACVAAAMAVGHGGIAAVLVPLVVTASFCFVVTFARAVAQPIASTSVIILAIYFVALGGNTPSIKQALWHALAFMAGGAWAALLSLVLWPVDPFRPARLAVAMCYLTLAELPEKITATERDSEAREAARQRAFDWQRRMRDRMEAARVAMAATAARSPSRTHRARNLTVLLETADMLLAITLQTTELALAIPIDGQQYQAAAAKDDSLRRFTMWLSEAERAIARGLQRRPNAGEQIDLALCSHPGPEETAIVHGEDGERAGAAAESVFGHLAAAELEAVQNIEIACEAVKAIWSGVEARAGTTRLTEAMTNAMASEGITQISAWADAVRANWTLDSVMMRHALRMTVVGAVDVLLLRALHLSHSYWLGMTSIIVLQPYPSHTLKRGMERVGGTIAGGVLAAVLAAAIPNQTGILLVLTLTSVLTLATYRVDYGWYCFFLTPTFVLMTLPRLGDWKFSGVRILTTFLGAAVAVTAMRVLWPEREHLALRKLLGRSAAADAAYLRALLRYGQRLSTAADRARPERRLAEQELLAPARRNCGLASNDAEESLDRLKLESGFGRLGPGTSLASEIDRIGGHALSFATYIRRLTQSITTFSVVGRAEREAAAQLEWLASRMETVSAALLNGRLFALPTRQPGTGNEQDGEIAAHQLHRMERQVSVLERTAVGILDGGASNENSRFGSVAPNSAVAQRG